MKLVIVESPKKCQTIARYLGDDFMVMASQGHIRDLSTHGKGGLGIDLENGYKPDYEISKDKFQIVAKLREACKKAETVYLATDPDREGEAISWHLAEVLHLPVESTSRLLFHEITRPAIEEAMKNPLHIDQRLVQAQEARRMEDRIIGFRVSSLLQKNLKIPSAGRVQSATLAMIVDRQEKINAFVPEEYWTIEVNVLIGGKPYAATLTKVDGQPFKASSKEEVDAILARFPQELTVTSIVKTPKSIAPKLPLTTSSLQQEAYTKYHFSNTRIMTLAQGLYEGKNIAGEHVGLITYMRTDSTRLSPNFFNKHAKPFIEERFGSEYVGTLRQGKKNENIQDAHEAIRPTGTHRTPEIVAQFLTPDETKIYRLIYNRAMVSVMAPKKIESTSVVLEGNGMQFSIKGSRTLFKGFSILMDDGEEEASLPPMEEGAIYGISAVNPQQKFTKPEPPYNEASIVKAMEENGIGRPSTYATTISTLIKRKYVTATKGVLAPTETGVKSIAVLRKYFPDIVDTHYTAGMESTLDNLAEGKKDFLQTMDDFYLPFEKTYNEAKKQMYQDPDQLTGENCPLCGKPLLYKRNRKGEKFIGCSGYPHCHYVQKEQAESEPVGENCPDCGAPLVYKKSKKGEKFIGCSRFPSCHYTRNLKGDSAKPKPEKKNYTEKDYVRKCPDCADGYLVVKKYKRRDFLGCTNYPNCHHFEWADSKTKKSGDN